MRRAGMRTTSREWRSQPVTHGMQTLAALALIVFPAWSKTSRLAGGESPLARAIAHLGLSSIATDVSPIAVRFQRERSNVFARMLSELGPADPAGSFTAEIHDFRNEFRREAFDFIINVKAFQAFTTPDMTSIARVHAAALRKGRCAYFDTMNIQGEGRDRLEMALEDGGFVVPWIALDRWYRQELEATGIPHTFILGQPMIPFDGEYSCNSPKRERDTAILREITAEYERRGEAEKEAEEKRQSPDAKVAQVIYSTG
jgi:hypothetical protein